MTISAARSTRSLTAIGTHTETGVDGSPTIGTIQAATAYSTADVAYTIGATIKKAAATLTLDVAYGTATGTTHVAGAAQIETATVVAASGCTSNGNCVLVVTSDVVAGSPLNVTVALTTASNTATLVATALAAGLAANAAVAAHYTVTSNAADIILTRTADSNGYFYATDSSLNLAIPAGIGITAAATSTGTLAGTATSGTLISSGGAGLDFEGNTIPQITTLHGICVEATSGSGSATNGTHTFLLPYFYGSATGTTTALLTADLVITAAADATALQITVIGKA